MAYTKQTWENLPSQTTPINADRLTHIEDGIFDAAATADTAASNASSAISGLADKVDKVEGKGLSTNDFTDALQTKLNNIEAGAEVNVQSDWNQSDNSADDYIKNKPSLGTSAYKNSTSVVTDSTDLVESGAVKDIVGWGNKNLLPNDATSQTVNGITFTVNSDGSVTANGTATVNAQIAIYLPSILNGDYLFSSGLQPIGSSTTYDASVWDYTSNARAKKWDGTTNSDLSFDNSFQEVKIVAGHSTAFIFRVRTGNTVNNVVLEPMICHANETDTTYEPYHASVSDSLAEKCDNSVIGTVEGANASKSWSVGEHFIKDGQFKEVTQPISSGGAINSSNTTDRPIADCLVYKAGDSIVISDDTIYQIPVEGYLTSAGKAIFMFIRFDKPLSGVTNISFSSESKIYVRGASGYILNGTLLNTLILSATKIVPTGILAVFGKTDGTAFNETDSNKAVNIALLNCTVTLS